MGKKYIDVVKIKLVKECKTKYKTVTITSTAEAGFIIREYLSEQDRECFIALLLNTKHKIQSIYLISMGTLEQALVHPREVFKAAVLANTKAIILAHNHPSGNPEPSEEDISLTRRIVDAGELLGIAVIDHIIVGNVETKPDEYFSFLENGMLCGVNH